MVVLWTFASGMSGPIIYDDEHGPIEIARTLVSQQEVVDTKYYPGYGLLLVPAVLASDTAYGEYRAALITNVALIAVAAVALYATAVRHLPVAPWRAALAIAAVFSIPYVTSSAALVWSEAALIAAATAMTAMCLAYKRFRPWWLLCAIGATAGGALLIHPRMVAAVPAAILAVAAAHSGVRARGAAGAICGGIAICGLIAAGMARSWIVDSVGSTSTYDPAPPFERTWAMVSDLAAIVIGRAATDILATVALPVVALAIPSSRRALKTLSPALVFGITLTSLQLAYTGLDAARLGIQRADFVYYSRYQGPGTLAIAAIAALAIASVSTRGAHASWRPPVALLACLVATWTALKLLVDRAVFALPVVQANIPELAPLATTLSPGRVVALVAVTGLGLLLVSLLPVDRAVTLAACTLAGLTLSHAWFDGYAHPGSRASGTFRAIGSSDGQGGRQDFLK